MNHLETKITVKKTVALTSHAKELIDKWLLKFPPDQKQSAVIYALHVVQAENKGFLTEGLMDAVADYLEMPKIAVYEVASFYSMYELSPVGKYKICICTNISCMLCGVEKLAEHVQKRLGIGFGETTQDGRFTLKSVECLAACGGAPAIQINKTYYEQVTPEKIDSILAELT